MVVTDIMASASALFILRNCVNALTVPELDEIVARAVLSSSG